MSPEQLQEILTYHRFDVSCLSDLEQYVAQQVAEGFYNHAANLACLKFYSVFPDKSNQQVIAQVMLLAMMRLPSNEFTEVLYLVPAHLLQQQGTPLAVIERFGTLMEGGRFEEFWADMAKTADVVSMVPGFANQMREVCAASMEQVMQSTSRADAQACLGLSNAQCTEFFSKRSWKVEGNMVKLPRNEHNYPVAPTGPAAISVDKVTTVMNSMFQGIAA